MDLHSPRIKGKATLDDAATYEQAKDLVPREFVELKASGFVVIRDIVPSDEAVGIVGVKEYIPNTVPAKFALERCITNTPNIRVLIECEPDRSQYTVGILVNGKPAILDAVAGNSRLYTGYCDLEIDPDQEVVEIKVTSTTGEEFICDVRPVIGGPVVQSAQVDELPVGQTHVKAGDVVSVSGVVENDAVEVRVEVGGAAAGVTLMTYAEDDSAGEGFKSFLGTVKISDITTDAPLTFIAKNYLGTESESPFVTDPLLIDQQYPIIPEPTYAYPAGQLAVKDGETVGITSAITHATSARYSVFTGFVVADPEVLNDTKQVTLNSGEGYSFDNEYYVVTAFKATNGSQSTAKFTIDIGNAEPQVNLSIVNNPARLRTDADGNDYKVRVISNQPIHGEPVLAASAGELVGAWSKKSDKIYERTIRVKDSDPRGAHTFQGLVVKGRANVQTTTILSGDNYIIAGFLMREVVAPALSQKVAIGTFVNDATKIVAYYKDADRLTYRPNTGNARASFSIVNAEGVFDPKGSFLWISDEAFAGTNTSGTLTLTVEEL